MQVLEQDKLKNLMKEVEEHLSLMKSAKDLDYYEAFVKEFNKMSEKVLEMKEILGLEQKEGRFTQACKILFAKGKKR